MSSSKQLSRRQMNRVRRLRQSSPVKRQKQEEVTVDAEQETQPEPGPENDLAWTGDTQAKAGKMRPLNHRNAFKKNNKFNQAWYSKLGAGGSFAKLMKDMVKSGLIDKETVMDFNDSLKAGVKKQLGEVSKDEQGEQMDSSD